MLVKMVTDDMERKTLDAKETNKVDMLNANFWMIGGQHITKAMNGIMRGLSLNTQEDINSYCNTHEIVIIWS